MAKKPTPARIRRSPVQLLADLKTQRDSFADKMQNRLAGLDAKIIKVEQRYQKSIALAELEGVDKTELDAQLEKSKRDQRLIRLSLKAKRAE